MTYLNVACDRRNLFITEIDENGKLHYKTIKNFQPEIFTNSSDSSEWKGLTDGKSLAVHKKETIADWYSYRKQMESIDNIDLYNVIDPEYQYIRQEYSNNLESVNSRFWYLDIETGLGENNGFPNPSEATAPITLIQIAESDTSNIYIFGMQEYTPETSDVIFIYCETEKLMLERFIQLMLERTPAITTAWNGDNFDFPFIINRLERIGINCEIISPFGKLEKHRANMFGQIVDIMKPLGFVWIDTIEAYKKAKPGGRESWSLEYMSKYELGEEEGGKLDYTKSGFRSMKDFILKKYEASLDTNNDLTAYTLGSPEWERAWYTLFVKYGIEDSRLLMKMDRKVNMLNTLVEASHLYGCNIYDVFATIKPWQIFIYKSLYVDKLALPLKSPYETYKISGGYVFAIPGLYSWIISEDYTSLYPMTQISLNLSPECQVQYKDVPADLKSATKEMYDLRKQSVDDEEIDSSIGCEDIYINYSMQHKEYILSLLKKYDFSMAPNGTFYRRSKEGILVTLLKKVFAERKHHKSLMKDAKNKVEELKLQKEDYAYWEQKVSNESTSEQVRKIIANSEYGFCTNAVSMIANSDVGGAITSFGRLNIKMTGDIVIEYVNKTIPGANISRCLTDTDSMYLVFDSVVKAWDPQGTRGIDDTVEFLDRVVKKIVQPVIDSSSEEIIRLLNARENTMNMDREGIFQAMIVTGKKRYAALNWDDEGTRLSTPKKKIVGLDIKRSDVPTSVRTELGKIIDLIFEGDNSKLIDFYTSYENIHKSLRVEDIAIPSGVSDITKYENVTKSVPMHVRASKVMNDLVIKTAKQSDYPIVVNGDKIKYVFLKTPNPIKSEVIAFKDPRLLEDFGLMKYVDYKRLFERTFESPLVKLTDAINWKLDLGSAAMMDLF